MRHGTLPKFEQVRQQVGTAQAYQAFVETADTERQPSLEHLMFD
ncbi:hypothetical protein [Sphaerothrix gracilis]